MRDFEELKQELLEEFCADRRHQLNVEGFRDSGRKVSERDAADFVLAMNIGLVTRHKPRQYRAPQSRASEQFFWTGSKKASPRPVTLSIEPIISVAVLARLHFEYSWPKDHLGTQSPKWGFDVCAYEKPSANSQLVIACEVKKTEKEVDLLIDLMQHYGASAEETEDGMSSKQINAFRKVQELRVLRPMFFWAVGPNGYSRAFRLTFQPQTQVMFQITSHDTLGFVPDHRV